MTLQGRLARMSSSLPRPLSAMSWRAHVRALTDEIALDRGLVAIFVASRLLIVLAAIVAEYLLPRNPLLVPGDGAPILTSLTSWDGWYYLGIVHDGYQAAPVDGAYSNVAFAPLYPTIVRALSMPLPGAAGLVAVVVSNVAFLVALGLLVRLGTPYLGRRRASLAASLLVIHPFASVFAMAYTESLFLLLMVAGFLAVERRHRVWAGVFLALAVLCRLQGVALLIPMLLVMLGQDAWRARPSHGWILLGPMAAAGFFVYLAIVTGSTTAYLDAHQAWGRTGLGSFEDGQTVLGSFGPYQAMLLATLSATVFLFVFARHDRIPTPYVLLSALFLVALLVSGSLESVGRITMLAFPLVWILANRRSLLARRVWPMISAGLFMLVALLSFGGYWVP